MREIKFRYVWRRKEGGHVYVNIVPVECLELKGDQPAVHSINLDVWELVSRDQFTGLLDRDGKEIFEGDILGGHPHATVYVRWSNISACFESVMDYMGFNDDDEPVPRESAGLLCNDLADCGDAWSVIGNIHESPELLEKENMIQSHDAVIVR